MSTSVDKPPEGTFLDITRGMLAGGVEANGIPAHKKLIDAKRKAIDISMKEEGSHCTCHTLVLGLLAVIAAAASATLFAFSGGPNNLQLFVPACAFGVAAFGLTIWLIVVISRSIQKRKELKEELEGEKVDENNQKKGITKHLISNEEILQEMQKGETTEGHIQNAMKQFTPEQRRDFMQWTKDQYFPENDRKPLSDDDKKVMAAFARFPGEILALPDIDTLDRDFALQILANIDPDVVKRGKEVEGKEREGKVLITKLFAKVDLPKTDPEREVIARHPVALALLVQVENHKFIQKELEPICTKMNFEQRTLFLKQLADDRAPLEAEKAKDTNVEKKRIHDANVVCISMTLTPEFAAKFKPAAQEPSDAEKADLVKAKALLRQIGRSPHSAAHYIYLHKEDVLPAEVALIGALYDAMEEGAQKAFVEYARTQLNHPDIGLEGWINWFAANNTIAMPQVTKDIYAGAPIAMAHAMPSLTAPQEPPSQAWKIADEILKLMTTEQMISFLSTERTVYGAGFTKQLTGMLQKIQSDENPVAGSLANNLAVVYLKKHPEDFNNLVINNVALGSVLGDRATFALSLLEHMGAEAEKIIANIDDKDGFDNYNACLTMLKTQVDQRKTTPKDTAEWQRLVAMFKFAPQKGGKTLFFGDNAVATDDVSWASFNAVANPRQNEVWRKDNGNGNGGKKT